MIFFAFYGFDTISTAAEEAKNPGRDLPIGIVGSMLLCTLIYMAVATTALGAVPAADFAKSAEPLALILRTLQHPLWATLVAGAAILAFPTVIMVFMYGQSRIFFVMARDRLLPPRLAKVNSYTGTPIAVTIFTGVVAAAIAGLAPLKLIAELANAGTLCAFIAVALSMMLLRLRKPQPKRDILDAAMAAGRHGRDRWLPLSVLEPAQPDAALVLRLECIRHSGLRALRNAQEQVRPVNPADSAPLLSLNLQRHAGFGFGGMDDQRSLDAGDILLRRQRFGDEGLERRKILRHAFEKEIHLAGQHVALADCGPRSHALFELLEIVIVLAGQADKDKAVTSKPSDLASRSA